MKRIACLMVLAMLVGCEAKKPKDYNATPFGMYGVDDVVFVPNGDAYIISGGCVWQMRGTEAVKVKEVAAFTTPSTSKPFSADTAPVRMRRSLATDHADDDSAKE